MAGFVNKVSTRLETLLHVAESLDFPWLDKYETVSLKEAIGKRIAKRLNSEAPYPLHIRSLRDGYAVQSQDVLAATAGTPTFLRKIEDVVMGSIPSFKVEQGEAVSIPTGGILPEGSDSVVMLENTSFISGMVEIRKGVQSGENIIGRGEEISEGEKLLCRGDLIDFTTVSILATLGLHHLSVFGLKISVLSSGDEVVSVDTTPLPLGCIRDVNSWSVISILKQYGFSAAHKGIVSDDADELENRVKEELKECDVLILSGGSSVGTRDNSSRVLEKLEKPGLLTRGLNIAPGKPTLIAGCLESKKLVISLPGHPLSCITVVYVMLIPLLLKLIGAENKTYGHKLFLKLSKDLNARTGPEEFVPCKIEESGEVTPLLAKSGYISVLFEADGLIRIPEERETVRIGEMVEVWTW